MFNRFVSLVALIVLVIVVIAAFSAAKPTPPPPTPTPGPATPIQVYGIGIVAARPDSDPATVTARWNEHITGYLQTVPLAPAKLTGSLWLQYRPTLPECVDFNNSLQKSTGPYIQTVAPHGPGPTAGMLGFMFWAAEVEGTRTIAIQPPNKCENGMGGAASFYNIPIPMPSLRQQ